MYFGATETDQLQSQQSGSTNKYLNQVDSTAIQTMAQNAALSFAMNPNGTDTDIMSFGYHYNDQGILIQPTTANGSNVPAQSFFQKNETLIIIACIAGLGLLYIVKKHKKIKKG